MKKKISVFDYAEQILNGVKHATLVSTKLKDQYNVMTIEWGMLGIEWGKPMFILLLRDHRYTKQIVDETGEFTVNIPIGPYNKKVPGYCGTISGRNVDKIKELNLHPVEGEMVSSPALEEFPLTLECKVLYAQKQDSEKIPQAIKERYYPQDVDGYQPLCNRDFHTAYYGEIVNAYILENCISENTVD